MASQSDDEDDDFISYGVPLEDEEDQPTKNPTAVENQVVKDAQGRRRFHGAFTGGFSAGYFNSVGSKEGWTPSAFVSSRSCRIDRRQQTVEDFMDDEDLGEYGIAPRTVKTADQFTGTQKPQKRTTHDEPSVIPGPAPLEDIVTLSNLSIGAEILQKMGWREGQGVGPKVRKYKKKQKGKSGKEDEHGVSQDQSGLESYEDKMQAFLFGPSDVEEFLFQTKSDQKGLGYSGISQDTSVLGGAFDSFGASRPIKGKRKGIAGSAFGIGAFEDRDDDIYSVDDMNMYDTVLGDEDSSRTNFGWTAPKSTGSSKGCLEGFTPAVKAKTLTSKVFPPPALPHGYRPVHVFTDAEAPKEEEKHSRFSLSSEQRSALLGEELLPGKPVAEQSKALVISSPAESLTLEPKRKSRFSSDTDGTDLVPHQKSKTDGTKEGITEWERQRSEISRTSSLSKPMSSMIASRFVSAQFKDEEVVEFGEVIQADKSHHENAADMKMYGKLTRESFEWYPDHILCKRFNVPHPYPGSSFVGVPGLQKEKVSVYNFLTNTGGFEEPLPPPTAVKEPLPITQGEVKDNTTRAAKGEKKRSRWDIKPAILSIIEERRKNVAVEDSSEEKQDGEAADEVTETRPPMDLFNAIFNESDSSDSDDDSESGADERKGEEETDTKRLVQPMESQRGHSPSKDKEKMVTEPSKDVSSEHDPFQEVSQEEKNMSEGSDEDQFYGPSLPPPGASHQSSTESPMGASNSAERQSRSTHRKHKKHHHHHSRSHSRKHRKESRRKDKKEKKRKEKKHSRDPARDSHRESTKHKKRQRESDSSYTSASEG